MKENLYEIFSQFEFAVTIAIIALKKKIIQTELVSHVFDSFAKKLLTLEAIFVNGNFFNRISFFLKTQRKTFFFPN
jgi:hypothetical protein